MERKGRIYGVLTVGILTLFVLPFIWLSEGYLLFHVLAENICILIALVLYIVGTRVYRYSNNHIVLFVGTGYLFVAILGVFHALSYKGMDLFRGIDASMATQFWVARRGLEASILLLATFDAGRRTKPWKLNAIFGAITAVLVGSILARRFPACFVEGTGLTPFKKISEYVIIALSVLTLFRMRHLKRHLDLTYVWAIAGAVAFGTAAEIAFTMYSTVFDTFNVAGHLLYVFSSGLVGVFIVKEGLDRPYDLMFRELYQKSIRDQLTGLLNRHGLAEMVHTSFERSKRFPATFCVLMMDLDNFKSVNDEYGHPEGDLALAEFARLLLRCFREYDIVARVGGDEFAVVLEDGTDITEMVRVRLGEAVSAWTEGNSRRRGLDVTYGMAVREAGSTESLESLLSRSDAALITAKALKRARSALRLSQTAAMN